MGVCIAPKISTFSSRLPAWDAASLWKAGWSKPSEAVGTPIVLYVQDVRHPWPTSDVTQSKARKTSNNVNLLCDRFWWFRIWCFRAFCKTCSEYYAKLEAIMKMCEKCGAEVENDGIRMKDKWYHAYHFKCAKCKLVVAPFHNQSLFTPVLSMECKVACLVLSWRLLRGNRTMVSGVVWNAPMPKLARCVAEPSRTMNALSLPSTSTGILK